MVLLLAIKDHASDIHFEPFEDEFKIRIKADGVLYEMVPPPRHLAFAITTRIKVMANLDIAERRLPQDGRIELTVGGHPVDLRVSVLPRCSARASSCECSTARVVSLDLDKVGMDAPTLAAFREVISKPNGIVLVTGPTGSGKTTTLYSALNELNSIEDKMITTEDPVEYDIDGIIQVPIDPDIGNTFAHCLRAILRQDPDKILVGEIRDLETAEIAVQASLTGHLVFSTLHTNDAPSTITRLQDMGVPTFLITATVEAILAQRLVRRICTQCREETTPHAGDAGGAGPDARRGARQEVLSRQGLRRVQQHGLQGPRGPVRADDHERRPARHDHGQRVGRRAARRGARATAWWRCATPALACCQSRASRPSKKSSARRFWKRNMRWCCSDHGQFRTPCQPINSRRWTPPARRSRTSSKPRSEEEAQATIRQMGYFVTKIAVKKAARRRRVRRPPREARSFAIGGVQSKHLTAFTRQLSILQDAGLPILRSLRILEGQCKAGRLKNSLMDVCEEIEGGATLSEAMAKSPKAFNRLYVNMIKAGEAGGALEVILQRLADFQERAESLKRKIKGAMIYPVVVIIGGRRHLDVHHDQDRAGVRGDLRGIRPEVARHDAAADRDLQRRRHVLVPDPGIPIGIWLFIKLVRKFRHGRMGWDMFMLKVPIFGPLVEKNILARTTRTLGTLVASGVPILEGLQHHARDGRQRVVRTAVRQGDRSDPRGRDRSPSR